MRPTVLNLPYSVPVGPSVLYARAEPQNAHYNNSNVMYGGHGIPSPDLLSFKMGADCIPVEVGQIYL